eukprot:gnl/TRDRNA2_/TRDRNA2_40064_c0_seq1.p1 gnl/TRDRNA2_/TRDRNA2_40064_c0~~gnl/TRDRNA2_/TRDRNA2_40064_c0_seq1.p1  ORF type:complete len:639 (+),score=113.47 gnl/TRDRNA2_/TRDRNA2_40064_c0_seq1:67-1983(+)
MIRYPRASWITVFYWWGGINRQIVCPAFIYMCLLWVIYFVQKVYPAAVLPISEVSLRSLAGFVAFLLVFRLNQCMRRQNRGESLVGELFATFEHIIGMCCVNIKGVNEAALGVAADSFKHKDFKEAVHAQDLGTLVKVNVIRLTMALAISWVIHCRLLDAASAAEGVLGEDDLHQIVYLYFRLEGMLYAKEMELIDQALCITCESCDFQGQDGERRLKDGDDRTYRVEVNRYRTSKELADENSERFLGGATQGDAMTSMPLPKVILMMLGDLLMQPLDLDWGYPQRMMNAFLRCQESITDLIADLNILVANPLPLAYLQHCRCLLLIFAVCYPMSVPPSEGLTDNIVMPFFIFWSMLGFEYLGEMLENPLGDDETDLNLMEFLHNLEVSAKYFYDVSEIHRVNMRQLLWQQLDEWNVKDPTAQKGADGGALGAGPGGSFLPKRPFETFFRWTPMPKKQVEDAIHSHGNVDSVHMINFRQWWSEHLLRQQKAEQNGTYDSVDDDFDKEILERDRARVTTVVARRDTNICAHYLVFLSVHRRRQPISKLTLSPSSNPGYHERERATVTYANPDVANGRIPLELARHVAWKRRVRGLLEENPATVHILEEDDQYSFSGEDEGNCSLLGEAARSSVIEGLAV